MKKQSTKQPKDEQDVIEEAPEAGEDIPELDESYLKQVTQAMADRRIVDRVNGTLRKLPPGEAVIAVLEKMAPEPKHKSIVIDWLQSHDEWELRSTVRALAKEFKPAVYLEVGVWRGWSMAQVLDVSPDSKCIGVDLFKNSYSGVQTPGGAGWVEAQLRLINPDGKIEFWQGDSTVILPERLPKLGGVDMALIDGSKHAKTSWADISNTFPWINKGGVVILDDLVESNEGGAETIVELWARAAKEFTNFHFMANYDAMIPLGVAIRVK